MDLQLSLRISTPCDYSANEPIKTKSLPRQEFTSLLAQETMRDISEREVDLIFEIFDVDSDGVLGSGEVAKANDVLLKRAKTQQFLMK